MRTPLGKSSAHHVQLIDKSTGELVQRVFLQHPSDQRVGAFKFVVSLPAI